MTGSIVVGCFGLGARKLWSLKTGFNVGGLITCDTFTVALYSLLQDASNYHLFKYCTNYK